MLRLLILLCMLNGPTLGQPAACPYGNAYADGCTTATKTGSFANTAYFGGAKVRPPWNVAGVDYAVGLPAGASLLAPSVSNIPACTAWQSSVHALLRVTASNCTISGYDFMQGRCTSQGGCGIYINSGVSNTTITGNNFGYRNGAYVIPVQTDAGAGGGSVITWNTINQAGPLGNPSFGTALSVTNATIKYNYIYNTACQFLSAGGSMVVKYNYFSNGGQTLDCHLNYIQWGGSINRHPIYDFNTILQEQGLVNGEVVQMYTQGTTSGSITNGDVSYNSIRTSVVLISGSPGGASPSVSYIFHNGSNPQYPNTSTGAITNNYLDVTSAYGAFYRPLSGWTCTGNINMLTGAASNSC